MTYRERQTAGPDDGRSEAQDRARPVRPDRPALVELASAFLVVTGLSGTFTTLLAMNRLADTGTDPGVLSLLSLAIGVGSFVLGLLVRYGHAWIIAVNVVAVAGFLELVSGTGLGLVFAVVDVFVLVALFSERAWFTWSTGRPGDEGGVD